MCGVPPPSFYVVQCPHPMCYSHQQSMCGVPPSQFTFFLCGVPPNVVFFPLWLCLGFKAKLRIWQVPAFKMKPSSTCILECGTPSWACFNNKNNHNKNISSITYRFQSLEVYFKDQQKKTSTTTKTNNNIIISAITYPIWTKFKGFLLNINNRNDNNKNNNKLGLSCAKLSLALASNLLLWTSCEFGMDMDMSWKRMNKSWTCH